MFQGKGQLWRKGTGYNAGRFFFNNKFLLKDPTVFANIFTKKFKQQIFFHQYERNRSLKLNANGYKDF